MKAISPNQTFKYIMKSERELPPEEQTVFHCNLLSAEQEALVDDNTGVSTKDGYQLTIGTSNLLALHLGLFKIENMADADGNPFQLKRDETKAKDTLPKVGRPWLMSCIDRIPREARDEVAVAIKTGGELEDETVKN